MVLMMIVFSSIHACLVVEQHLTRVHQRRTGRTRISIWRCWGKAGQRN